MAKVKKEYKQIAIILVILGLVVLFFGAISLSGTGFTLLDFFKALFVQIGFIGLGILAYSSTIFAGDLIGLGKNKIFHIWTGVLIGIAYIILSGLIPGFSIATPLLPGAISSGLQWFVVVVIAPVVESVIFLGVVLGLLQKKISPIISVFLTGLIASLFHLGSYVVNLYSFSIEKGLLGFSQNISVFLSAFIFFSLSAYLVKLKAYRGLLVSMIIHIVVNFFVITKFAII